MSGKDDRLRSLQPPCAAYPSTISQTGCRRHCSSDRTPGYPRPSDRPHLVTDEKPFKIFTAIYISLNFLC